VVQTIYILNESYDRIGVLKEATTAIILEEINGLFTLSFTSILTDKLRNLISDNTTFECDGEYFDVALMDEASNEDGTYTIEVQANHVSMILNYPEYDMEEYIPGSSSIRGTMDRLLEGTPFATGTIDPAISDEKVVRYGTTRKNSRRQLLMGFIDWVEAEIKYEGFVDGKFLIGLVKMRGTRSVRTVIKGRNVRVIRRSIDKQTKVGENLVSYTCEPVNLPGDEYELGDDILVIDTGTSTREALRVIRIEKNPYDEREVRLVFGVYLRGLVGPLQEDNMIGWTIPEQEEFEEEDLPELVQEGLDKEEGGYDLTLNLKKYHRTMEFIIDHRFNEDDVTAWELLSTNINVLKIFEYDPTAPLDPDPEPIELIESEWDFETKVIGVYEHRFKQYEE
jgi:hypothetical protein